MNKKDFTFGENIHTREAMTRRNPKSKIRSTHRAVKKETQVMMFAHAQFPTWQAIKRALETLPEGWRTELADRLNVGPSAVTMFMERSGQPSYDRVVDIIAFLDGKGVKVE